MTIDVLVKPNSKKDEILQISAFNYQLKTTKKAVSGAANKAAIELLAIFFNKKKSQINLVSGLKSKNKRFEIT